MLKVLQAAYWFCWEHIAWMLSLFQQQPGKGQTTQRYTPLDILLMSLMLVLALPALLALVIIYGIFVLFVLTLGIILACWYMVVGHKQ